MNGEELLHRMDLVEDAYIEEAAQPSQLRRNSWLRAAIIAACICLALGGTAVLAAGQMGIHIIDLFTLRAEPGSDLFESGYDLTAEIQVIPIEQLNQDSMNAASAQILHAYGSYEPHMSWWPGHFQKKFDTAQAAWEYIGCDFLVIPDWDLPQQRNEVNIISRDASGAIQSVELYTIYQGDGMHIQCSATIWTRAFDAETVVSSRSTEALEYTEKTCTSSAGLPYLTIWSSPLESGILMVDGYITRDGILYYIHIPYREADTEIAENYLTQWANMF